jgi:DNA polymerase bacteriophage-type
VSALHLDFETCSAVNLKTVGAHVYARHPSTQVICASYALNDDPVCTTDFRDGLLGLKHVDTLIQKGVSVHGWNVVFERLIWSHVIAPRLGFEPIRPDQTVCTMATAALYGLPLKLATAAQVIGSPYQKNLAGHGVMLRMARPRSTIPRCVWWHETDPAKLDQLIDYNRDDNEAERAISKLLPRMTEFERRVWLADQRMNDRGMPVDSNFLVEAFTMTNAEMSRLSRSLELVTAGRVTSINQVGALTDWLEERGYPKGVGVSRDMLELALAKPQPPLVLQALSIRHEAAKSSTAKLHAIDQFTPTGGRACGLVQYGGAIRTLRWAGRGPQLQNFPRPSIKHVGVAADAIAQGIEVDTLRQIFGQPLDVISSCLRGAFKAPQGQKFVVCDFSGIEARVLAWLAGNAAALGVFKRNEDIYVATAKSIGSTNRQLGKVLVLACGYGMGPDRFRETANAAPYSLGLSIQTAKNAVYSWRDANPETTTYWRACEQAFLEVVDDPIARPLEVGKVTFRWAKHPSLKGAALITLPSGRSLIYRGARMRFDRIVYEGNDFNHNWGLVETWGGKIVENITQAVARDLLAHALLELTDMHDPELLATNHDEIIGLTDASEAQTLFEEMRFVMSTPPTWAKGLPLAAAGFIGDRYGK